MNKFFADFSCRITPKLKWLIPISICITFSLLFQSTALASSTGFENEVLNVINENPEVIWRAYETYLSDERRKNEAAKETLFSDFSNDPHSLINSSPVIGEMGADNVVVVFSDFQCPYCAQASETLKKLISKHEGEIAVVYKHFPLSGMHPEARSAAKAAWAAGKQNHFWDYYAELFEQQQELGEAAYINIARALSLDLEQFNQDRKSLEAEEKIEEDTKLAQTLGINGTPSFLTTSGLVAGSLSLNEFEEVLGLEHSGNSQFFLQVPENLKSLLSSANKIFSESPNKLAGNI